MTVKNIKLYYAELVINYMVKKNEKPLSHDCFKSITCVHYNS